MNKIIITILISFAVNTLVFSQNPRYQKITAGEYFINIDPGEGNGIPIAGNYGYGEVNIQVNNLDVPIGSNIYVRFKSTNDTWSAPRCIQRRDYFTNSQATLQYGEYFINNDPGRGNGTPISFNNGVADITNLKLKRGDKVYFRIRDSFNRWSPARPAKFNFKDMHKAEYYIQLAGGGTTSPESMTLIAPDDSSSIFEAIKNSIPWNDGDTVYVRFQTKDRFYSKWQMQTGIVVPVEFAYLTVNFDQTTMEVNLEWQTATETNNYGFEVERAILSDWGKIGFVKGNGTTTIPQKYSFIDNLNDLNNQMSDTLNTTKYRLKQIDFGGAFEYSSEIEVSISLKPLKFSLSQNYPNPFNPTTIIKFSLPKSSQVTLKVFDILGREVMTLLNEKREAGVHSLKFDASNLASGLYFYKLQAVDFMDVRKMMIIK